MLHFVVRYLVEGARESARVYEREEEHEKEENTRYSDCVPKC